MLGLGTLVNTGAIVLGGIVGMACGKKIRVANLLPALLVAIAWAFVEGGLK